MPLVHGGMYKHKNGDIYEIIGFAKHTETEEELVIYYNMSKREMVWVRPVSMFEDGRFEFIGMSN